MELDDQLASNLSAQVQAIKSVYTSELTEEFRSLGWWGRDSIDRWRDISVPIVLDAQTTAASIAEAVFDAQMEILLDGDNEPSSIDYALVTGQPVRGVPVDEVYSRAFKPVWQGLGNGIPVGVAVEHGVSRLERMLDVDIERVVDKLAIEKFANDNRIVGYRRVLSGGKNCALCIVASTQMYHKRELKGIHPGCNCKVSPVLSFESPKTLDRDLLERVHGEIERQFGISARDARQIDYRKIMLVRNHGEYGPSLTFSKYNFTGPSGLKTPGE